LTPIINCIRKKITAKLDWVGLIGYVGNEVNDMLIKFTAENTKNFKDPVTLDFKETHDYKFNSECVRNGILNTVVIYGPNGSGKSNFGLALFDIVGLLTDKQVDPNQKDELSFINADSDSDIAKFDYWFKNGESVIHYAYQKSSPSRLVFEEMYIDGEKIYSYDFKDRKSDFAHMEMIGADALNFEYFENNFAILRYIANNTIQNSGSHVRFVMNFVSHMLWFRSLQTNSYIGLMTGIDNLNSWIIDNNLVKDFQKFLGEMAGLNRNIGVATAEGPAKIQLLVEQHKKYPLIFDQTKSSGTAALELLFYWSRRFKDVSFLFIDEFDAFYHFELARNVLMYVAGIENLQSIFTTHNSYLASNNLLRPDCYFMLSDGQLKSFADSTDRELREGHNLEKMLRNGEFDA